MSKKMLNWLIALDQMRKGKEDLFDSKVKEFENRGMMGKKGRDFNKFK